MMKLFCAFILSFIVSVYAYAATTVIADQIKSADRTKTWVMPATSGTLVNSGGNVATATALASNPTDCGANNFAYQIDASGNLTCSTVGDAALALSYLKDDGTRALTGNWNAGAFTITASTFSGALSGNASTATALAANPTDCAGGQFANAIDASGNLTCATPSGSGDFSSNTATSVDGEVVLFSGTGGKTGKRATQTGVAKLSSGVLSASNVDLTSEVTGTLPVANGGTGQTTYTDGQLLIGNTSTGGLSKATLTAGSNITITNGNGSITIASTGGGGGSGTVQSAVIGGTNTNNNCDGTNCALFNNTSSITGVTYNSAGRYTLTLSATGCTAPWVCTAAGYDQTNARPVWCGHDNGTGTASTTNFYFQCRESGGAQSNGNLKVMCTCK